MRERDRRGRIQVGTWSFWQERGTSPLFLAIICSGLNSVCPVKVWTSTLRSCHMEIKFNLYTTLKRSLYISKQYYLAMYVYIYLIAWGSTYINVHSSRILKRVSVQICWIFYTSSYPYSKLLNVKYLAINYSCIYFKSLVDRYSYQVMRAI